MNLTTNVKYFYDKTIDEIDSFDGLFEFKARRFYMLGIHLATERVYLELFPKLIEHSEIYKKKNEKLFRRTLGEVHQKEPFIAHPAFIIGFIMGGRKSVELADRGSFINLANCCFAIYKIYDACSDFYRKNELDYLWKILPKLEIYSLDVIMDAMELIGYWNVKMERSKYEKNRVDKSIAAKKEKKAEKKQSVLETFYRSNEITKDMKLHKVATIIKKDIEEMGLPSGSTDTIIRYLKEEPNTGFA